jgi:hypothetical protein
MREVYLTEHVTAGELRAAKVMRVRDSAIAAELVGFRQEALFACVYRKLKSGRSGGEVRPGWRVN